MKNSALSFLAICAAVFAGSVSAFVPNSAARSFVSTGSALPIQGTAYIATQQPIAVRRSRSSVASVQTMSLFGLGGPELAIILIAAAFLLGPQKLAELGKDAGKIAGELKEVPKEFQAGMAEGEAQAKQSVEEISASKPKAKDAEIE